MGRIPVEVFTPLHYSRRQLAVFLLVYPLQFSHSMNSSACFISRVGLGGVEYSGHDQNSVLLKFTRCSTQEQKKNKHSDTTAEGQA